MSDNLEHNYTHFVHAVKGSNINCLQFKLLCAMANLLQAEVMRRSDYSIFGAVAPHWQSPAFGSRVQFRIYCDGYRRDIGFVQLSTTFESPMAVFDLRNIPNDYYLPIIRSRIDHNEMRDGIETAAAAIAEKHNTSETGK